MKKPQRIAAAFLCSDLGGFKNLRGLRPLPLAKFQFCRYLLFMAKDFHAQFLPNTYYHVFNHAVGKEKLFLSADNYHYFLHLFDKYICPVADVLCYCLLPSHFHFFIATKDIETIRYQIKTREYKREEQPDCVPDFLLQQFSNCFNAYTKALNKQQARMGKLFMEPFNRRKIDSTEYFTKIIHYIHANPVHHGYCQRVEDWVYSSYHPIISRNLWLQWEEVVQFFGSIESYKAFHQQPIQRKF